MVSQSGNVLHPPPPEPPPDPPPPPEPPPDPPPPEGVSPKSQVKLVGEKLVGTAVKVMGRPVALVVGPEIVTRAWFPPPGVPTTYATTPMSPATSALT